MDFPRELVGPAEIARIVSEGKEAEKEALLCNPSIAEELLIALYKRTDVFAQIPEGPWCGLVYRSRKNERLRTEHEYSDMPDMDFYHIQKAIFGLLEIAPVEMHWLTVLYDLLGQLDFQGVAHPEKIDHVLTRWAALAEKSDDGKPSEGYVTSLSLKDEFRCLIAALYGRGIVKGAFVVHGSPQAEDVAVRCAYYGKENITAKEMKAGYERDKEVFTFAVVFNDYVYAIRELRTLLEDEYLLGDDELTRRYFKNSEQRHLKNSEQRRKRWPNQGPLSEELRAQEAEAKSGKEFEEMRLSTASLETKVSNLSAQISELKNTIWWVGIAVVIAISLQYWR